MVLGADYNYSYSKDKLYFLVEDTYIEQAIKQVLHDCYGGIIGSVSKSDRSQFINHFKKWNWLCIDNSGNMRITIEGISLYNNLTKGAK